jgi:acyl-coenzyme A thioesterase PaaI-like protein
MSDSAPASTKALIKDPLSQTLGLERIVLMDGEAGRAILEYRAGIHMCHSGGVVQGGFITGWLDAAMAHAVIAAVGHDVTPMSLELKVSFFAPTGPGLVTAEGWIERRGKSTCFGEARLLNPAGEVLAKCSSTLRLISRAKVEARTRGSDA